MPAHHYTHTRRAIFVRRKRRSNADATIDAAATLMTTTLAAATSPSSTEHDVHVHVQHFTETSRQDAADEASGQGADEDEDEDENEDEIANRLMARCLMAVGYAFAVRSACPSGSHMAPPAESGLAQLCFDVAPFPRTSLANGSTQGDSHARVPTDPDQVACVVIDGTHPIEGSFQVQHPSWTATEEGALQCELTVTTRPDRPSDWEQWNGETVWIHHLSPDSPPSVLSFRRPLGEHHSEAEEMFISVSGAGEHEVGLVFGVETQRGEEETWMIGEPQGWSVALRCDRSVEVQQVGNGEKDSSEAADELGRSSRVAGPQE